MRTSVNLFKKTVLPNGKSQYKFFKCKEVILDIETMRSFLKNRELVRPYFSEIMQENNADELEVCIPASVFGGIVSQFVKTYHTKRGLSAERMAEIRKLRKKHHED